MAVLLSISAQAAEKAWCTWCKGPSGEYYEPGFYAVGNPQQRVTREAMTEEINTGLDFSSKGVNYTYMAELQSDAELFMTMDSTLYGVPFSCQAGKEDT